ncbi:MAG TPA: metal ABC transporter permease, partial [Rhodospirillum rubrum]|nr:metal ABC transporter permease [Rhodospirillum rubrum]
LPIPSGGAIILAAGLLFLGASVARMLSRSKPS